MRPKVLLAGGLLLVLAACATAAATVEEDLAAAVARSRSGATLRIPAGTFQGPLLIDKPLTIVAEPGAILVAPADAPAIEIMDTDAVTLRGLHIEGGHSGIRVERAEGVVLEDITVSGAQWHGILAHNAEIHVSNCIVRNLQAPLPQGVEIINSDARPESVVRGCRIEGPVFEGVVAHVSHVRFEDNEVTGSIQRGIVITEMSDGVMAGNSVTDAQGSALYCGDMSNCSVVDNDVTRVISQDIGVHSAAGHGLVVDFHSQAFVEGLTANDLEGEDIYLMLDSRLAEESLYP